MFRLCSSLFVTLTALALFHLVAQRNDGSASTTASGQAANADFVASEDVRPKELFTGKVVLLQPALKKLGIPASDEFKHLVALQNKKRELIPIVPDWRGRAFYQDERLRDRKVELIGSRRPGVPLLQVLVVYTFDEKGDRQYTDYWCDICSIPMYELKPCDCCQDDIRLRFQPRDLPSWLSDAKPSRRLGRSQAGPGEE